MAPTSASSHTTCFRYLDERVFTFNSRHLTDLGRFSAALSGIAGRQLTYAALTAAD
jgi:hypothetical protein